MRNRKKNIPQAFVFLMMLILPAAAFAEFPMDSSWNSVTGGFSCYSYSHGDTDIDCSTSSPNPSCSLKFIYDPSFPGGSAPATCSNTFGSPKNEIYGQYFFKYSSNWTWHGTVNKQAYVWYGSPMSWAGDVIGVAGSARKIQIRTQHAETVNYASTTGYDPQIQANTWYKVNFYFKINTPGAKDGVGKVWINDQLVMSHTNIKWLRAGDNGMGFYQFALTPVWGGTGGTKSPSEEYLWFDRTIVQSTAIGSTDSISDVVDKEPNPPSITGVQ